MKVFSGQCLMCDAGIETGEKDMRGEPIFTGDIVQLWHGYFIGTDIEEWYPSDGLTVVVARQYQSYSDGTHVVLGDKPEPFTMGIKETGVKGGEWDVRIVKSHSEIIPGERLKSFGFNFKDDSSVVIREQK